MIQFLETMIVFQTGSSDHQNEKAFLFKSINSTNDIQRGVGHLSTTNYKFFCNQFCSFLDKEIHKYQKILNIYYQKNGVSAVSKNYFQVQWP